MNFKEDSVTIDKHIIEMPRKRIEPLPSPGKVLSEKVLITNFNEYKLNTLLSDYKRNINQFGLIPDTFHFIKTVNSLKFSAKPYTIPFNIVETFKEEIKKMLDEQIIRPST